MNLKIRKEKLMPNGIPRWIRVYDNGGLDVPNGTVDRYTVCFTGKGATERVSGYPPHYPYLAMNGVPFHPQMGFCQHGSNPNNPCDTKNGWAVAIGRKCHLGRRITFQDLPKDCQKAVVSDYKDIWNLREEEG